MAWKHIFWNDDFIVTNKDNWIEDLAGKIFGNIQFEIYYTMKNKNEWPRFYNSAWDCKLKYVFLQILDVVKNGARDGPSAGKNSPKIYSIIIAQENKPHISIMGFDENQEPLLVIPQSLDELEFFSDILHLI